MQLRVELDRAHARTQKGRIDGGGHRFLPADVLDEKVFLPVPLASLVGSVHDCEENTTDPRDRGRDHQDGVDLYPQLPLVLEHPRGEKATERENCPHGHATTVRVAETRVRLAEGALGCNEADEHHNELHAQRGVDDGRGEARASWSVQGRESADYYSHATGGRQHDAAHAES